MVVGSNQSTKIMTTSKTCNVFLFGIGFTFLAIGVSLGIYGPKYFSDLYQRKVELSPTSDTFHLWEHTPIPLYLEVFLFNWTNAAEFVSALKRNESVVPVFEEVGPFVFREEHDKVAVVWGNNSVTYNQTRKWTFVPEKSENLSTEITNLNVVATTISHLYKLNPIIQKFIPNLILNLFEHFTTTRPANEWLFDGIEDVVLELIGKLPDKFRPPTFQKKFGWFYGRNMSSSYDGMFTVKTGTDDLYSMGIMEKWNGMSRVKYYKDGCGMVNGTSGELFPPMKAVEDNITIFVSDICSSITLKYAGSSVVSHLKSSVYVGENTTLDNGELNPENKCFCLGECAPYGARDVSTCRMGAPLFFSFPHFYLADESYTDAVSGMAPNKSEHEFMIQLDEITGIPTELKAQLQINLLLEPVPQLTMYEAVPKIYMPMMWFRQKATITPELAFKVLLIEVVPKTSIGICYALVAVGLLIVVIRLFVIWRGRREYDPELLIPSTVDQDQEDGMPDSPDGCLKPGGLHCGSVCRCPSQNHTNASKNLVGDD